MTLMNMLYPLLKSQNFPFNLYDGQERRSQVSTYWQPSLMMHQGRPDSDYHHLRSNLEVFSVWRRRLRPGDDNSGPESSPSSLRVLVIHKSQSPSPECEHLLVVSGHLEENTYSVSRLIPDCKSHKFH